MNQASAFPGEAPYYTLDTSLFSGTFRSFSRQGEPMLIRGKVHRSEEAYRLQPAECAIEPIAHLKGTRSYMHLKPYVPIPDVRLIIGLFPQPDAQGAIGEVRQVEERPRMKEVEIGQAQAWYYPADKIIILWECLLHHFVQDAPLLQDTNMTAYWQGFERFLQQQFPQAEHLVTPYHDPEYDWQEYQQFLARLGYQPHATARAAWSKPVVRKEEP